MLSWLLPEELSDKAHAIRNQWKDAQEELVAPMLLRVEVSSVLRNAAYRGRLTKEEADEAFEAFQEMPIKLHEPEDLMRRAWRLGLIVNASKLYDLYYLALAEAIQSPLWTADLRFLRLIANRSSLINWLGDWSSEASQ